MTVQRAEICRHLMGKLGGDRAFFRRTGGNLRLGLGAIARSVKL